MVLLNLQPVLLGLFVRFAPVFARMGRFLRSSSVGVYPSPLPLSYVACMLPSFIVFASAAVATSIDFVSFFHYLLMVALGSCRLICTVMSIYYVFVSVVGGGFWLLPIDMYCNVSYLCCCYYCCCC